jgi:hypothetical protein
MHCNTLNEAYLKLNQDGYFILSKHWSGYRFHQRDCMYQTRYSPLMIEIIGQPSRHSKSHFDNDANDPAEAPFIAALEGV